MISRRATIVAGAVVLAVGFSGFLMIQLAGNSNGAPVAFKEARLQGALISQDIVNLSREAATELINIEQLHAGGDPDGALRRTATLVAQGQAIRDRALDLSTELDTMTHSLESIDSLAAREAALRAITDWLTMISRLINYSGYLSRLTDALRNELIGTPSKENVSELILRVNQEVGSVNELDAQAREEIKRFDEIVE